MINSYKKITIISVIILLFLSIAYGLWQNSNLYRSVVVEYKNIKSLKLNELNGDQEIGKDITSSFESGKSISIEKTKQYILSYTADDDYESGDVIIDNDMSNVMINPEYSKDASDKIIDQSISDINRSINSSFSTASLYDIQRGVLLEQGTWYITKLTYKDVDDELNSDTLVVVLQKQSNGWVVALKPHIVFNKASYPNVPDNIIEVANRYSIGLSE